MLSVKAHKYSDLLNPTNRFSDFIVEKFETRFPGADRRIVCQIT